MSLMARGGGATALAVFKSGLLAVLAAVSLSATAAIDVEPLSTEEKEMRYRVLIVELRCPKCQNENLAESNAPIAADLRREVRRLLEEGKSDREIIDFLVARYGDYIRYRPPVQKNTLLLWFAPALLLAVALATAAVVIRRRRHSSAASEQAISGEDRERLRHLLEDDDDEERR